MLLFSEIVSPSVQKVCMICRIEIWSNRIFHLGRSVLILSEVIRYVYVVQLQCPRVQWVLNDSLIAHLVQWLCSRYMCIFLGLPVSMVGSWRHLGIWAMSYCHHPKQYPISHYRNNNSYRAASVYQIYASLVLYTNKTSGHLQMFFYETDCRLIRPCSMLCV